MKSLLFIAVLYLITVCGFTNVYSQDFVVTAKGDTLRGKVKLILSSFDHRVQVQDKEKKKTTLLILQVRTVFIENERFDPVKFNNKYSFMKLLKEGYLSLYGFQYEKQLTYDGQYLLKKDGKGIEVPNLGFKKNMSNYLSDCEGLSTSIAKGDYGRNDLEKIIDEFNACIAKNTITPQSTTAPQNESKLAAWNNLETKVIASSINAKSDALEMITDIKLRVSKGEKLPKFLVQGLTSALAEDADLSVDLENALKTIE
jgi:hypothetical protein